MAEVGIDDVVGLPVLVAAIRLGSISAAARELRLTQPAASEQVRRLEQRLGLQLLLRGPSGSAPTPEGAAIADAGNAVLRAIAELGNVADDLRDLGAHSALRIAASQTIAEYLMPAWLSEHQQRSPAPVAITVGNSEHVIRLVSAGHVDLGFIESPIRPIGLRWHTIARDQLLVVVSPRHPWARRSRPIDAAELACTPLLVREPGSGTREVLELALNSRDLTMAAPIATLGSTTTLKTSAIAGLGPCVVSGLAVRAELSNRTLVQVPLDGLDLRRPLRAVWRPDSARIKVQRFVRVARAAARTYTADQ